MHFFVKAGKKAKIFLPCLEMKTEAVGRPQQRPGRAEGAGGIPAAAMKANLKHNHLNLN